MAERPPDAAETARLHRLLDATTADAEKLADALAAASISAVAAAADRHRLAQRAYHDELLATAVALWVKLHPSLGIGGYCGDCLNLRDAYVAWRENRP